MKRSAFEANVTRAGLEIPDAPVEILGSDPILPTPYHLAEGAATVHSLIGAASASLFEQRTGRVQSVRVDVRHAVASLNSLRHLVVEEAMREALSGGTLEPSTSGLHQCGDGRWIQLQSLYPHLHQGVIEVLECEDSKAGVAAGVKRWNAADLEQALVERQLCGSLARSPAEWAAHPQGRVLAGRPTVEIERIGDSAPEALPAGDRPLSGVRVLDLTHVLAGPTCPRTLAEHGAEVLHISSPTLPTIPMVEIDTGHGKRQIQIDLEREKDVATLRRLIGGADVFTQGFRSGSFERRGLDPAQLAELRPGIIYVSVNCYGHDGPWRERPGWEMHAQTVSGIVNGHGSPEKPVQVPVTMNDYTTGYFAALGVLLALERRTREGGSWHVKASLCQTAMWYERLGADCDASAAPDENVAAFLVETDSLYGRLTHLRPVLQMSHTPPRWEQPPCPLGSHEPEWSGTRRRL